MPSDHPSKNLTALPIEVQDVIKRLLFQEGKFLDETDLELLAVFQEPMTVPTAAKRFSLAYYTILRRCNTLAELGLLHPVARKGKAPVYLTGVPGTVQEAGPTKGKVRLNKRELSLQEYAFMVSRPGYIQMYASVVGQCLVHLSERLRAKEAGEEILTPAPLTVRQILEGVRSDMVEFVDSLDSVINMPIFDDSVGARQYLGVFQESRQASVLAKRRSFARRSDAEVQRGCGECPSRRTRRW